MKLYRKVMLICLALMVVFSFSACKEKKIEGTENMTPQQMIENAALRLEDVDSYTAKVTQNVSMNSNGNEVGASGLTEIIFFKEPLKVKITQAQDETTQEELKKVSYVEEKNDTVTTYMNYNNEWLKMDATKEDTKQVLQSYNPAENMLSFLKEVQNIKEDAREEVDGTKVIILSGVLPKETVPAIVEETQALQFVGMSNLKPELYEGIVELPITFQIEEATGDILGYSFDLHSILQTLTDNTMKALMGDTQTAQIEVSKCFVEVLCSDYNNAPQIEIPQEALNAPVYTGTQTPAEQ